MLPRTRAGRSLWLAAGLFAAALGVSVALNADRPVDAAAKERAWDGRSVAELRALYSAGPQEWPAPEVDAGVDWQELGLPRPLQHRERDPRHSAEQQLGRLLFFDGRLSGTGQMSCATCHAPELGWADGRRTSLGHDVMPLERNTPSLRNSGHFEHLFWDGRSHGLEDLVRHVFRSAMEMRVDEERMVAGLATSREYRGRFEAAFGDDEPTADRVVAAIASYVRSVQSTGRSAFDRFLAGDEQALSDSALRGLHLFRTRARCLNCHHGPLLTDGGFHDLGLSYYGRRFEDLGRYQVTSDPADVGRFKTPSLRDVTRTAPYMHNGLFDLPGVLNMYSAGMPPLQPKPHQEGDPLFPVKSPLLRPLGLIAQEKQDLTAFLTALEEPRRVVRVELPAFGDWPGQPADASPEEDAHPSRPDRDRLVSEGERR